MKWWGALAGLMVGMLIDPWAGVVLAFLGWIGGGLLGRALRSSSTAAAKTDPAGVNFSDELASLHRDVQSLTRRLRAVEHELAALKASGAVMTTTTAAETPTPEPAAEPTPVPVSEPVLVAATALSVAPPEVPPAPAPRQETAPLIYAAVAAPVSAPAPAPEPLPAAPRKPLIERLPTPVRDFLFGGNTLVKVGVLLLFLGLAFLLRYAAERVTVSLPLRYTGVAGVGAVLLGLGWRLRQRRAAYALTLQGAGIGVFYLTALAAMKLHGLIEPGMGFAFLLTVTALSGVLAVLQNARVLAIVAALEGFAAPVLVSTGSTSPVGLFTYLTVLNLGIVGIAWFKAWRPLHLIGLTGTLTLAGGWAQARYTPEFYGVTQGFLLLFMAMFSGIGLMFARRSLLNGADPASADPQQTSATLLQRAGQALQTVGRVDSALVFGAPLSAYGLQYLLVQDKPLGPALAALGFGLFHLLLGRLALVGQHPGLRLLAEAHAIVAVLFGTLAIPLGLEGQWTGAAWAVEAAGMYWLGLRQQRPYARLFALLVLAGASTRLLSEIHPSTVAEGPRLTGSLLGPLLLAGSAAVMQWLGRREAQNPGAEETNTAPVLSRWAALEPWGQSLLPWVTAGALTLLPWMLLRPILAPAALAALALALHALAQRRGWADWPPVVAVMQALSVMGLLGALQVADPASAATTAATASQAVLADGWLAMFSGVFIAACLIGTAWLAARPTWLDACERGVPPAWSLRQSASLVTGAVLLHLTVLFVAPWSTVAWIWPLMALLTLGAGLRGVVLPLVALSAGVQVSSALLAVGLRSGVIPMPVAGTGTQTLAAVVDPLSWTFLVQALVALASAAWLHALGARREADPEANSSRMSTPLAVLHHGLMRWLPLGAGVAWWLFTWSDALLHALAQWQRQPLQTTALVGLLLFTGTLMRGVAQRHRWHEMGSASLLVLPGLVLLAVWDAGTGSLTGMPGMPWQPSHDGNGWAWVAALVWQVRSLRRWPTPWPGQRLVPFWHTGNLWLFTALASLELSGHLAQWSTPGSTWSLLGGVAVVATVLFGLSHPRAQQRWPLNAQPQAYAWAAVPLALWSGVWLWWANAISSGDAAPLPSLPLLNPLELGLGLVAGALLMWQRSLPSDSRLRLPPQGHTAVWGSTGLALLTGVVLRACHHLAGVPWSTTALWNSTLAQAALSITWALSGVLVMLWANRRGSRSLWVAGAALLGVVVLKLFLVELADHGGLYRIVSFIGVGVLLLLVGYFAPVPSRQAAGIDTESASESAPASGTTT